MIEYVRAVNSRVVSVCQFLAILVISIGIVKALIIYIKDALFGRRSAGAVQESRLELGHSFSLGLGFLIGASILNTTIAPTWNDIGQLAAIIAIRTVLNYFLLLDIARSTESAKGAARSGNAAAKGDGPPAGNAPAAGESRE